MFSTMTLALGPFTGNLDASGYYWVPTGTRRVSFDGVQSVRTLSDMVCNTAGAQVSVWVSAWTYNQDGTAATQNWLPAGPYVGNSPQLIWGDLVDIGATFPEDNRDDMLLKLLYFGTPNANITVYWAEIQMVG